MVVEHTAFVVFIRSFVPSYMLITVLPETTWNAAAAARSARNAIVLAQGCPNPIRALDSAGSRRCLAAPRAAGKPGVLRAAPESVALGNGTNNVSTPSVAHGAPERPAERL